MSLSAIVNFSFKRLQTLNPVIYLNGVLKNHLSVKDMDSGVCLVPELDVRQCAAGMQALHLAVAKRLVGESVQAVLSGW